MKQIKPTTDKRLRRYFVDHSIDVRYETDIVEALDKFIKKWCGIHYSHLIDNDENDGQFMRDKIDDLLQKLSSLKENDNGRSK